MKKLSAVYVVHNQHALASVALDFAIQNSRKDTEFIVLDNGSDTTFAYDNPRVRIVRNEANMGVYPAMWWALHESVGDYVAVFHSDLVIVEEGWDSRVLDTFDKEFNLGLLGFFGSNEIDAAGGRGLGSTSNYQGHEYYENISGKVWKGSAAHIHGAQGTGFTEAAVVDGCAMIFQRDILQNIPMRMNFPIHHFYDKLLSCEVLERKARIGVLGIACDHISGQTANQEKGYHSTAELWCEMHNIPPVVIDGEPNWDLTVYHEAERQWLTEYRDTKKLIPIKI